MKTSGHSLALLSLLAASSALASSALAAEPRTFDAGGVPVRADVVADGLQNPWGLDFLPGGEALVTERGGRMRVVSANGALSDPLEGVPNVWTNGQGGLLDVAVARDFATSGTIFFTFSEPGDGGAGTALARAKLVRNGAEARLDAVDVIFSMAKKTGKGQHFGSRVIVNDDGTLFLTSGDRGEKARAQDPNDTAGAVIRINQDGSIPDGNPFVGEGAPELWSKGHRNVQGAALDPKDGVLWTVEHGAKGGDELNRPEPGKNYGWPVISYGVDYSGAKLGEGQTKVGFEQPAHYWDPSIAPSGLAIYRGAMFPEWDGDFLVGALKFQLLSRLDRDETGKVVGEERLLDGAFGRIRDVNLAPDGSIWLLTDEAPGAIVRLSRGG